MDGRPTRESRESQTHWWDGSMARHPRFGRRHPLLRTSRLEPLTIRDQHAIPQSAPSQGARWRRSQRDRLDLGAYGAKPRSGNAGSTCTADEHVLAVEQTGPRVLAPTHDRPRETDLDL